MARKSHARLPTGQMLLQATRGKDRRGRPRRGVWLALPIGTVLDLGWGPGDTVEVRRVGRHVELHKRDQEEMAVSVNVLPSPKEEMVVNVDVLPSPKDKDGRAYLVKLADQAQEA